MFFIVFKAVFREDMLRRDIEDLQKRYQVCKNSSAKVYHFKKEKRKGSYFLLIWFSDFLQFNLIVLSRQVSGVVRS